jgi:hypothetical protein
MGATKMLAIAFSPGVGPTVKQMFAPSGEIDGWNACAPEMWIACVGVPAPSAGFRKILTSLLVPLGGVLTLPIE